MKPTGRIKVQVVPRANVTQVAGRHGDAIRIRIAAPPVDGAANDELVRFIARQLGVMRSAVKIDRGQAARRKIVTVEGITTDAALHTLLEGT